MKKRYLFIVLLLSIFLFTSCGKKEPVKYKVHLTGFTYSYGNYTKEYCDYSIISDNKTVTYRAHGKKEYSINIDKEIDYSYMDKLDNLIKENNITDWDGFDKYAKDIEDGNSFSIQIGYDNGDNYYANGYMIFPDNYNEVHEKIIEFFDSIE